MTEQEMREILATAMIGCNLFGKLWVNAVVLGDATHFKASPAEAQDKAFITSALSAMQEVSRLATLEERERAAKICDENWNGVTIKDGLFGAGIAKASREIATAIRSQPDKEG